MTRKDYKAFAAAREGETYIDWRLRVERGGGPTFDRDAEPRDSLRHLLEGDDRTACLEGAP